MRTITGQSRQSWNDVSSPLEVSSPLPVRAPDGSYETFAVDGEQTEGNAINDKGAIAGGYFSSDLGFLFGYLRTAKGKLKPFDPQPAAPAYC